MQIYNVVHPMSRVSSCFNIILTLQPANRLCHSYGALRVLQNNICRDARFVRPYTKTGISEFHNTFLSDTSEGAEKPELPETGTG